MMECSQIIEVIRQDPTSIKWKKSERLDLPRNRNNELGVMINTYQGSNGGKSSKETYTVITKVKEECELPRKVNVGDRIIRICKTKIDKWDLDKIEKLLHKVKSNQKTNIVPLTLCKPDTDSLPPMTTSFSTRPKLSLSAGPSHSATHERSSGHSGTLTPVDPVHKMSFPRGTAKNKNGQEQDFSSLEEAQDLELVGTALAEPWRIKWDECIKTINVKKRTGRQQKIGVYYKYKVEPGKEDGYCIVERVDADGPAHGLLHPGDLVHSVNSQPIMGEDTMRDAILHCQLDSIKLCIQRPMEIISVSPSPSISKFSGFNSIPYTTLADSDIKIKGFTGGESKSSMRKESLPSVKQKPTTSNGVRKSENVSVKSAKQKEVKRSEATHSKESLRKKHVPKAPTQTKPSQIPVKQIAKMRIGVSATDDSFVSRASGAVHMDSFRKGHRRNLSDSSSVYYKQQMPGLNSSCIGQRLGDQFKQNQNQRNTGIESNPFPSLSHLSCSLNRCLSKWTSALFKKHTDHFPYVRFIQMNTTNSANVSIHKKINQLLNIERGLENLNSSHNLSFRGNYVVSGKGIKPLNDDLRKSYTIEDIILSRCGAAFLKELKFVLDNRSVCLKELAKSSSKQENLIGQFLENPPDIETHFIGIESMMLKFAEVCRTEYSVIYSENSIFFVTIDIEQCTDSENRKRQLGRIHACVNNIRMACKHAHVCFITDSADVDPDIEQEVACQLSDLYTTKRICGCGHGVLQVVQNSRTSLPLFNMAMHRDELKAALLQCVSDVVHGSGTGRKFPLLALKLNQLLEQQKSLSPVITQTQILEMLHEICPNLEHIDSVMKHALCGLHTAGKVVSPGEIQHAAGNEKLLQIFILHRPHALIQCMRQLRALSTSGVVTEKDFMSSTRSFTLLTDSTLTHYLQLFHCIEHVNQDEYRFLPDVNLSCEDYGSNVRNGAPMYRFDFDGFLPIAVVNYLFCALARQFRTTFQLEGGGLCAVFELHALQTRAVLSLNPYQSMGTLRFQGPGGAHVYQALLGVQPEWLTVYPDSGSGCFSGFHNSYESLNIKGLETPIKDVPYDLLQVLSTDLHPHRSGSLGNDVRMLAEILLQRTLSQQDSVSTQTTLLVLAEFVTIQPSATLQMLLDVIFKRLQRKDIVHKVNHWLQKNNQCVNFQ